MAITQTGAMYKSLSFDNTSSRSYGVYITGEAVYNAPERAVEMISIPGRNGAFALDQGRFENIEVSYPAGIFAENEADFAQAVSDFRNFLCSKKGYCRLTDEYNPSEYRMAVYKSGLEVDPAQLRAGEFTITFECKPQRWLTSGETASTVANNGTMTNPTLFDASPLLEVTGYGTIGFNGHEVELDAGYWGDIELYNNTINSKVASGNGLSSSVSFTLSNTASLNSGDDISMDMTVKIPLFGKIANSKWAKLSNVSVTSESLAGTSTNIDYKTAEYIGRRPIYIDLTTVYPTLEFNYLQSQTTTNTMVLSGSIQGYPDSGSSPASFSHHVITVTVAYDGHSTINISIALSTTDSETLYWTIGWYGYSYYTTLRRDIFVSGYSTKQYLGNPTYIDCDLGEAYRIDNGVATSLNAYIDLGSDLPKLAPGSNTFTKDNTITQLKVTPRWWKV